jgi:hypothetical protein
MIVGLGETILTPRRKGLGINPISYSEAGCIDKENRAEGRNEINCSILSIINIPYEGMRQYVCGEALYQKRAFLIQSSS